MLMERLGIDNPMIYFSGNMTIPCFTSDQDYIIRDDNSTQINTNCKEIEEEEISIIENQEDLWLQEILKLTTVGDSQIQPFSASNESHQCHLLQSGDDDFGFSAIMSNCDAMIRNIMSSSGTLSSGESENCGSYRSNKEMNFSLSVPHDQDVLPQFRCSVDDTSATTTSSISSKRKENGGVLIDHHVLHLLDSPTIDSGSFQIQFDNNHDNHKKPKLEKHHQSIQSNIDFRQGTNGGQETDTEAIAQVKEMIYRAAALRPVTIGIEENVEKPKRRNVKISSDPQTVAARQRREKISERLRVLQKLVPGGTKMDTATMLDEAANYLKFLKSQVCALENVGKGMKSFNNNNTTTNTTCQPYFCNAISNSHLEP